MDLASRLASDLASIKLMLQSLRGKIGQKGSEITSLGDKRELGNGDLLKLNRLKEEVQELQKLIVELIQNIRQKDRGV